MCRRLQFAALVALALFFRSEEIHKEEINMASNFVANVDDSKEGQPENRHQQHHHLAPSPRGVRRSWSTNSSTCGHGAGAIPKCVCAPATHAGSFKCRLHRATSQGHSPTSPTSMPPPPRPSSSSSTHTVEAQ